MQGLAYTNAARFRADAGWALGERAAPNSDARSCAGPGPTGGELDPYLAEAHATLAWILHWQYRRDEAIAEFNRALELNPISPTAAWRTCWYMTAGRRRRSPSAAGHATRPTSAAHLLQLSGQRLLPERRLRARLQHVAHRNGTMPGYRAIPVWLAAAAAQSGRDEVLAPQRALVLPAPKFTIAGWLGHIKFDRQADADHLAEATQGWFAGVDALDCRPALGQQPKDFADRLSAGKCVVSSQPTLAARRHASPNRRAPDSLACRQAAQIH